MNFLATNNFDFNMLFRSPINYTRTTEFADIYQKCVFKVGRYNPDARVCEALSVAH